MTDNNSFEITVKVDLDENRHPKKLHWAATDAPHEGFKDSNAMMMSIWDPAEETALRIDLWTQDFRVDEMDRMVYETIMTMADTYGRATGKSDEAVELKKMAQQFGLKIGLLKMKDEG